MFDIPSRQMLTHNIAEELHLPTVRDETHNTISLSVFVTAAILIDLLVLTAVDLNLGGTETGLASVPNISDLDPDSYESYIYKAPYPPPHLLPRMARRPGPVIDAKATL
jgi:hypothetical protein